MDRLHHGGFLIGFSHTGSVAKFTGNSVAVLVKNGEATPKRIEQKPGQVVLHPANASTEAMSYSPEEVHDLHHPQKHQPQHHLRTKSDGEGQHT